MQLRYYITDVFTPSPFAGNQLAVLPQADGLSDAGMQQIAREFNFAETTFVVRPSDPQADCRVRIFTPRAELRFAGHPTVGTACALVRGGHFGKPDAGRTELVLEEGVGPVQVAVERAGGGFTATLTVHAQLEQPPSPTVGCEEIARVLGLPFADVLETWDAGIGVNYCFVRLASPQAVDRAALDHGAWSRSLAESWAPQVFLFADEPGDATKLYARMFAPALGVPEDPATGSACGALAASLAQRACKPVDLSVVQGVAMGRRGEIRAGASFDAGGALVVTVGGACAHVSEGTIDVPADWLSR
ncbi:MAG: PhzF family phenazine biosynthesis protein [Pseudomonadota bacterium]